MDKFIPKGFILKELMTENGMKKYGFEAEIKYHDELDDILYPIIVLHRFYKDMRNINYKEIDEFDKKNIIKQIIKLFKNGSLVYLDYRFKIIKFSTDGYRYHIISTDYALNNIMDELIKEMIKNNIQGYIYGRCKNGEKIFNLNEYIDEIKRLGCETFNRIATSIEHIKKTEKMFELGAKKYNKYNNKEK